MEDCENKTAIVFSTWTVLEIVGKNNISSVLKFINIDVLFFEIQILVKSSVQTVTLL